MAQFILTARHSRNIGGQHIDRGQQFSLNVCMMGITPTNLFNNSRCADTVLRQFSAQGLDLPLPDEEKQDLIGLFKKITLADGMCNKDEALLMIALMYCLEGTYETEMVHVQVPQQALQLEF